MGEAFDREQESVGNIVGLEHVNVQIPEQPPAQLFYVAGLGLTRDPYMMVADDNMWVNVGRCQFHLPTGKPQKLRGHVGIVVPDRQALLARLQAVRKRLADTEFDFREANDCIEAISPWGNRLRVHEPDEKRFGRVTLGMPYVEFSVPARTAKRIVRFYREIMAAPAEYSEEGGDPVARVRVGDRQHLLFRETDRRPASYDGHHIAMYVADFAGPYQRLMKRGLVTREDSRHQYRFCEIADLDTGKSLFSIEHEIRSVSHSMHARPLVNRNPAQTAMTYAPGHDAWTPAMPPARY